MNGNSPLANQASALLRRREEQDLLNQIKELRSDYPELNTVSTLADLDAILPDLTRRANQLSVAGAAFDWASIAASPSFPDISSQLHELCSQSRKMGVFYHHMADHHLRERAYREAIRSYEQTLLYEANLQTRNDIFIKIAFSLYRLGSLQGLHYISIIKTNNRYVQGQLALINGMIHWEILKKLGKSIQFFQQAFQLLDHDVFLQAVAGLYLQELLTTFGDEDGASRYQSVLNKTKEKTETARIDPIVPDQTHSSGSFEDEPVVPEQFFNTIGEIPLHELEKKYIMFILNRSESLEHACQVLEIDRKTLYNKRKSWNMV